MIHLFNVTKHYGGISALRNISLTVEKGEFIFIAGPTGSGKSTLLKLLFGAERADEGQILIQGKNIAGLSASEILSLRRSLGVIFEDYNLLPRKTVYENVAIALHIMGVSSKEIKRRVSEELRLVGIEGKRDLFPYSLSGGEKQKVAIARALVKDPPILLADEPTGNLDGKSSAEILEIFKNANDRGTTVIIATNSREMGEKRGKIVCLDKGRILES